MDRAELSVAIIQELGELFVTALSRLAPELAESDLDGIERHLQQMGRSIMGKVVEQSVAAIVAAQPTQKPYCKACHKPMRLVDSRRQRCLQGLVGDYNLVRPYFICDSCHQGQAPLDERVGIGPGALSPGLSRVVCRLGIEDSFPQAAETLKEVLLVDVAQESVRRATEGVGQVAEAEQQRAVALAQAGQEPLAQAELSQGATALVVEVDGVMVHLEDDWHEMKVGVVAPLVAPLGPDTQTNPDRSCLKLGPASYCAGLEPAEVFWYRVYVEACRRGLGNMEVALVVVLGDGAEWIWRYARQFMAVGLVEVVEIVDIFHAYEHLWKVANAVFGGGLAVGWVEQLKEGLKKEGVRPVLEALGKLQGKVQVGDEVAAEEVRKAIAYFSEHERRMDYPSFMARQLPIGSGAVESACKSLIEEREKGAGMRWSRTGAQAVASLRALQRSGRWQKFWQTQPQRRRPAVFPRRQTKAPIACGNLQMAA